MKNSLLKQIKTLIIKNEQAISLMEILLGLMITVSTVVLIANIPNSVNLIGKSSNESLAKQIVARQIETFRSQGWAGLTNTTTPLPTIIDPRIQTLPSGGGEYEIIDCPVNICTNGELAKQVTVRVNWKSNNKTHLVDVITIIAKGGLI